MKTINNQHFIEENCRYCGSATWNDDGVLLCCRIRSQASENCSDFVLHQAIINEYVDMEREYAD